MEQITPGNAGGNPNSPQKVSIIGKVPIEYDPKSLNDVSNAIRDQTSAQQNAGNAAGSISERGIQQQIRANNISIVLAWLSGLAFAATVVVIVLNYAAINAANKSASIADSAFRENRRQFMVAWMTDFDLNQIAIYRHSYYTFYKNSDSIALSFQIENISGQNAQIDFIKYKWTFDSIEISRFNDTVDSKKIVDYFPKIKGWQTAYGDYYDQKNCDKEYMPSYTVRTIATPRDSVNIDSGENLLIFEMHYHVKSASVRFIFMYAVAITAKERDLYLPKRTQHWFDRFSWSIEDNR